MSTSATPNAGTSNTNAGVAPDPTATGNTAAAVPATKPIIKALKLSHCQSNLEKIELLDLGKYNWPTWSEAMMNLFLLNSCGGYIIGNLARPNPNDSPESASNWDINNLCVIAAIKTRCTREECHLLRDATIAKDAWTALRTRHE